MSKFFEKMDTLPIVRLLQVFAAIIFVLGIAQIFPLWMQPFRNPNGLFEGDILNSFMISAMTLARNMYQPLVLLALAEIIKSKPA